MQLTIGKPKEEVNPSNCYILEVEGYYGDMDYGFNYEQDYEDTGEDLEWLHQEVAMYHGMMHEIKKQCCPNYVRAWLNERGLDGDNAEIPCEPMTGDYVPRITGYELTYYDKYGRAFEVEVEL